MDVDTCEVDSMFSDLVTVCVVDASFIVYMTFQYCASAWSNATAHE